MATTNQNTAGNKRKRTDYSKTICLFCNVSEHVTRKSKFCIVTDQSDAEIASIMNNTGNEDEDTGTAVDNASLARDKVSLLDKIDCASMFSHNLYQLECSLENQD
jgi:hypothetical protein